MKNADMPATPCTIEDIAHSGLTKREHFAGLALQGLVSADYESRHIGRYAKAAVNLADALLKELDQ